MDRKKRQKIQYTILKLKDIQETPNLTKQLFCLFFFKKKKNNKNKIMKRFEFI